MPKSGAVTPVLYVRKHRRWSNASVWLRSNTFALLGVILIIFAVFVAMFANQIAPADPLQQSLRARLTPPVWMPGGQSGYILGTDAVGRDILSNVMFGLRVSLLVGFTSTFGMAAIGIVLGIVSGYHSGWLSAFIMRIADVQLTIPPILVALAVLGIYGPGLAKLIVIIALTGWPVFARATRSACISVRENEYILAVVAQGGTSFRVIWRHVLPNILSPVIVVTALQLPAVIMTESTLSFLGVGVPVNTPSLGLMVARGHQVLFGGAWWVSVFPGIALMIITIAMNLLGDWLRDALDPRTTK